MRPNNKEIFPLTINGKPIKSKDKHPLRFINSMLSMIMGCKQAVYQPPSPPPVLRRASFFSGWKIPSLSPGTYVRMQSCCEVINTLHTLALLRERRGSALHLKPGYAPEREREGELIDSLPIILPWEGGYFKGLPNL